ncbi:hypothetical protein [Moraxella oculi]|uniref:Uncharacterized protein n=1 Tax=Moraxella oculi TaxID=2940516 RepID=A0ABW8U764_9GAMM
MSVISKLQIALKTNTTAFDRGLAKVNDTLTEFSKSAGKMHKKWTKLPVCIVMPCKVCKVQGNRRRLDWV